MIFSLKHTLNVPLFSISSIVTLIQAVVQVTVISQLQQSQPTDQALSVLPPEHLKLSLSLHQCNPLQPLT